MILGLDVSTSITGATVIDSDGKIVYNEAWDLRKYIAATSARKKVGITVPKGTKAKECVIKHVIDNVPDVAITYTKFDNVKPECYDKADSWVIAMAGHIQCKTKN